MKVVDHQSLLKNLENSNIPTVFGELIATKNYSPYICYIFQDYKTIFVGHNIFNKVITAFCSDFNTSDLIKLMNLIELANLSKKKYIKFDFNDDDDDKKHCLILSDFALILFYEKEINISLNLDLDFQYGSSYGFKTFKSAYQYLLKNFKTFINMHANFNIEGNNDLTKQEKDMIELIYY